MTINRTAPGCRPHGPILTPGSRSPAPARSLLRLRYKLAASDGRKHRVFCIIGDGESDEGQIWEAAMFAGHRRLDNLIVICDYNKMQIDGTTQEILNLEPLADKWRAFGWEVFEIAGHDWDAIYDTLAKADAVVGKPAMIIAHTIKGKGNRETELVDSTLNRTRPPTSGSWSLECKFDP
jgi:transketolase